MTTIITTKHEMIAEVINDYLRGDYQSMLGLFDWLMSEKDISTSRILAIAERSFDLPRSAVFNIIHQLNEITGGMFHE